MKELKCKNCGAPLTQDGRCEYCGARYQIEEKVGKICVVEMLPPAAQTLAAQTTISYDYRGRVPDETLARRAKEDLTMSLAESIAEYMKLDIHEDPFLKATVVRGMVRVIPPDYRF